MGIPANHPDVLRLLANGQAVDTTPKQSRAICRGTPAVSSAWSITLTVPVQVVSEANKRDHWTTKSRRADAQRSALILAWNRAGLSLGQKPAFPRARVTWAKLGGRKLDDDNLLSAFKALRDCLAGWLGLDDGSERVEWEYTQEPGGPVGVRVTIEEVK